MNENTLKEGIDFYFDEDGLLVFMAKYLLKRNYCCGNGCRHCPYDYENVVQPEKKAELLNKQKENEEN